MKYENIKIVNMLLSHNHRKSSSFLFNNNKLNFNNSIQRNKKRRKIKQNKKKLYTTKYNECNTIHTHTCICSMYTQIYSVARHAIADRHRFFPLTNNTMKYFLCIDGCDGGHNYTVRYEQKWCLTF